MTRLCGLVFFFCKQKTAYEMRISDWSSDVCSSDLSVRGERDWSKPADALSRSDRLAPFRPASHSGAGVSRRTLRLKRPSPVVLLWARPCTASQHSG